MIVAQPRNPPLRKVAFDPPTGGDVNARLLFPCSWLDEPQLSVLLNVAGVKWVREANTAVAAAAAAAGK